MTVEIGILIAVVGCFVGLAGWLSGRDKKIANDAEWRGSVSSKLDSIGTNITDICANARNVQSTLSEHGERLSAVEASTKQAHHRLDEIAGKK